MNSWELLQTGGHVYVAVRDMDVRGVGTVAVGAADDSVVVHDRPYDDGWGFLEREAVRWWPLDTEKDIGRFLEDSRGFFTPEQQREILAQRERLREV